MNKEDIVANLQEEIWVELTPLDQNGQFWLIDHYHVSGRDKYIRGDKHQSQVDELRERVKLLEQMRDINGFITVHTDKTSQMALDENAILKRQLTAADRLAEALDAIKTVITLGSNMILTDMLIGQVEEAVSHWNTMKEKK